MSAELKKGPEMPTSSTSVPPPADDLRHVDRLATFGLLAAGVVHELGSSLKVAAIHADAIANGEVDGEAARTSARLVSQQIERITARLKRLLAFAHDAPPQRERVDVASLARHLAELFVPVASKRGVTLRMPPPARVDAEVDAMQIEQVVANLLLNAIQATPEGGAVELNVLEIDDEGERVIRIEVADEGPGMAPEHRFQIFRPFFTTKNAGEGTGLGLSVAEAIVRAHDGWIDVQSEAGRGACFRVNLPSTAALP